MEIIPIQRAEEVSSAFSNDRRRDYDRTSTCMSLKDATEVIEKVMLNLNIVVFAASYSSSSLIALTLRVFHTWNEAMLRLVGSTSWHERRSPSTILVN